MAEVGALLEELADLGDLGGVGALARHGSLAVHEVGADVGVVAHDADLALGLHGDAAGGDVGHGRVAVGHAREFEARVADVLGLAKHAHGAGTNLDGLRTEEHEEDVDVVDHHVEHHAHVDAAEGHGADAVHLHEARHQAELADGHHHRVVAHHVAHLQHGAALGGSIGNGARLGGRGGERLLDQAVDARGKELLRGRAVVHGGRGDGHHVHAGLDERFDLGVPCTAVLVDHLLPALGARIDHADEVATLHLRPEARMVASHASDADDATTEGGGAGSGHHCSFGARGA